MTWQWVALILGVVLLIVLLFAFIAWVQLIQTKVRLESIRTKKEEDANPEG
ncbi:MAG: hypothetical protein ABWY25_07695 [Paenisporosarcina sp.]